MLSPIVEALEQVGITKPFPIQAMAIPIALTGTDMIGQARTGTGKTLAFGISMLQRVVVPGERDYAQLAKPGAPQGLVVAPTRELASQVSADITTAAARRHARVLTVYGGVGYDVQLAALSRGVDVVVGTPGRLLDLANRGSLDLSHIKVLVLDEADEMLDLGFLPDVERILAKTPELRQTMLFSATMPSAIVTMARRHLRHPVNIRAESAEATTTVPTTAQFVYQAHDLDKPEVVARILQAENRHRVMIFCRTKRSAQRVSDDLAERGFAATSIHGDLNQVAREKALKRFREGKIDVLVATDVAARGIDVEGVTHVINYECPDDDKNYVHRIGRTGRAGASGIAITFVDWAGPDPLEGDQRHAQPALRAAGRDLLDLGPPVPRPRHRPVRQGPDRAAEGRWTRIPRSPGDRGPNASVRSASATGAGSATVFPSTPTARRARPARSPRRSRQRSAPDASGAEQADTPRDAAAADVAAARPARNPRPPSPANSRRRRSAAGRSAGQAQRLTDHHEIGVVAAAVAMVGPGAGDHHQPMITGLFEGAAVRGQRMLGDHLHRDDPVALLEQRRLVR